MSDAISPVGTSDAFTGVYRLAWIVNVCSRIVPDPARLKNEWFVRLIGVALSVVAA